MEALIFAFGLAAFVYEFFQWRKKHRNEPIAFIVAMYAVGLMLAWFSAKNAPIPSPARWIVPAFKPAMDAVSFWLD